jgi:hypothetical protein
VENPKVPKPVPVSSLDPERRALYEGLRDNPDSDVLEEPEVETKGSEKARATPTPLPGMTSQELAEYAEATDEDKKAFIRSVLSGSEFSKKYVLFGQVEVLFVDRNAELDEQLYAQLENDFSTCELSEIEWLDWLNRYKTAANVREVKAGKDRTTHPVPSSLKDRVKQLSVNKPLFAALLDANRCFEQLVSTMIQKAQEPNFWKTGGVA